MFDKNDPRHQGYFVSKDGKKKRFDFALRKCVSENGSYTKKQRTGVSSNVVGVTTSLDSILTKLYAIFGELAAWIRE